MKYKQTNLPNGGKLYYVKNKFNESTMVDILFDCGARYDKIPGLAHFTEHMFFTGTNTLTKEEITKKYFDYIGVNAYTGIESIVFSGQVFTKEFKDYLCTVSDMITKSTFTQQAVDKEIPVVQQEIAGRKDKYDRISNYDNDYNLFGLKEFKNSVLGNQKSVASIKSEDVKEYVNKFFVANNMEVFVASPLSLSKVKHMVTNSLANNLSVVNGFQKDPYHYYNVQNTDFFKITTKDIGKNYLYINFPINKNRWDFEFIYKFGLVLEMVNDFSRGIMKNLRLEKSLTYGAGIWARYLEKNGCIIFRTECDKENVNEIIKTLATYLKDMCKNGFTQEQLEQAKRTCEYNEITREEFLRRDLFKLYDYKHYNKIIPKNERNKVVKKTTLEECNTLFKEVFTNPKVCLSLYGNALKEDIISKAEFKKLFKNAD